MGLVNYTNIEDDTDASANSLNTRFSAIIQQVNGNIDTQNLKKFAVTRDKIAPQSVSSDKLFVDKAYNAEGWLVSDFGSYKRYSRTGTFNVTMQGNQFRYIKTGIPYPAGCTYENIVGSYVSATDQAISIGFNSAENDIQFNVQNKYGSPAPCNARWSLVFEK